MTRGTRDRTCTNRNDDEGRPAIPGKGCRLLCLILLAVLTVGSAAGGSSTKAKGRLAPDLVEAIHKHSPNHVVRLVVNLDEESYTLLSDRVTTLGGVVRGEYHRVGQMVVDLPAGAVERLTEVEGLDYVAPDRPVSGLASHLGTTTGASQVYRTSGSDWSFLAKGSSVSGFNGAGVAVAVVDSGIDPDEVDLRDGGRHRTILTKTFAGSGTGDDPYGHGTHVAGIIAGNGDASLRAGFDFTGIATAASLVNLKVLDDRGHGYISSVVAAIDFAITNQASYNLRVVNLSLAAPPVESYRDDPLCHAADRAVQAGLVVVAAAGNFGLAPGGQRVYGGITSPGLCPSVITVGATNSRATDVRSDDGVARYSSRGPTRSRSVDPETLATVYDDLVKPDLVAPGTRIVSLERYGNYIVTTHPELHVDTGDVNNRSRYMRLSGTSMSAAVVSGAVGLMLQANPSLTPSMVKAILMYSAQIMDGPDLFEQGAGTLNVEGAVRQAASMSKRASTRRPGQRLTVFGPPNPETTIAGETFAWSQGLIWGGGWLTGSALLGVQQLAYAQSLIWGGSDASAWGAGVTWNGGLFADDYVVFGKDGRWAYVTWDSGTTLGSGLLWREALSGSGAVWQNSLMTDAFFDLDPSSLIWGYSRYGYDLSLIWGFDTSLIWGFDAP